MFDSFIRFLKRLLVFVPGVLAAALVSYELYPSLDNRLPAIVAILIIYVIVAYFVLPLIIRTYRLFRTPKHVPTYCVTPDGFASDPVNIAVLGSKKQLTRAFQGAGWHKADNKNLASLARLARAVIFKQSYPNAPFSSLFLLGRKQDIGFQLPLANGSGRHHIRFWEYAPKLSAAEKLQLRFWEKHHPGFVRPPTMWLGAASLDTGLGVIRHNFQLTHMVHPDTNQERSFVVASLKKAGYIAEQELITIRKPYRLRNRVINASFIADGKLAMIELI